MAVITTSPLMLKDVIVDIAGNDYGQTVTNVAITPASSTVTFTGMKPGATWTESTTPTWTVALTYGQDWETTNSLSGYLFDNAGKTVLMTFKPRTGSGPSFKANVVIVPGAIGGAVNTFASGTVTLPVSGPVTRVAAA
jgi:hypothetical protein